MVGLIIDIEAVNITIILKTTTSFQRFQPDDLYKFNLWLRVADKREKVYQI